MKTLIVGQGAIGLLWYSQIYQQDSKKVQLLASSNHKSKNKAVLYRDIDNNQFELPIALASKEFIAQCELIIICVKAFQITTAVEQLASLISPNAIVVLCHNGMILDKKVSKILSRNQRVVSMLVTHGSKKIAVVSIEHTGLGRVDIGLQQGQLSSIEQQRITNHLSNAMPPVYWHENIREMQWQKLAINCIINPICALNDSQNKLVLDEQFQPLMRDILKEIIAIATQHKITLELNPLTLAVKKVATLTGENICSTLADIRANRATEIDHLNGFIHAEGVRLKIATPANSAMWHKVSQLSNN